MAVFARIDTTIAMPPCHMGGRTTYHPLSIALAPREVEYVEGNEPRAAHTYIGTFQMDFTSPWPLIWYRWKGMRIRRMMMVYPKRYLLPHRHLQWAHHLRESESEWGV
jgi:hypothetical protein